jgi:hypothetical protein
MGLLFRLTLRGNLLERFRPVSGVEDREAG